MADCATEASSKHTRGHPVHVLGYTKILRGAKLVRWLFSSDCGFFHHIWLCFHFHVSFAANMYHVLRLKFKTESRCHDFSQENALLGWRRMAVDKYRRILLLSCFLPSCFLCHQHDCGFTALASSKKYVCGQVRATTLWCRVATSQNYLLILCLWASVLVLQPRCDMPCFLTVYSHVASCDALASWQRDKDFIVTMHQQPHSSIIIINLQVFSLPSSFDLLPPAFLSGHAVV